MFPKPPGIPVFVMLPLDSVNADGAFKYASSPWFAQSLHLLANSGAYGVAVDVWWGAVEREPSKYTWSGYKQLLELIRPTGLKLQIVLSFHACGGNVGDTAHIPLPQWVLRCGENDPDLFFTDRPRGGSQGQRNREYLSVWADDAPGVLHGRSPMQCYEDFMISFKENFMQDLGCMVEEVVVGSGPCGELRFPSYVEANGWRFPGVGEFQCYDRRALASLAAAARERGCPEWGFGGPHDTGDYNSNPEDTGFYNHEGSWDSPYGRFFLAWYSGSLMQHGDRLMSAAKRVFGHAIPLHKGTGSHSSTNTHAPQPACAGSAAGQAPLASQPHNHRGAGHSGHLGANAENGGLPNGRLVGGAGAGAGARIPCTVSEAVPDGEQSDVSSMSFPDQDGDSIGHPPSDRSSVMAPATTSVAAACTPCAPPSLGTISQQSDSTDVAAAHAPGLGSESVRVAVDRTCSTVYMFNLLADDNTSECMTPDNASSVTAVEEGQVGEELRPGGSGQVAAVAGEEPSVRPAQEAEQAGSLGAGQRAGKGPGPGPGAGGGVHSHAGITGPEPPPRRELTLTLKIAGIHWWFRSRSHAAELTAGYYNTATRDGYGAVVELCVKHQFSLTLTCVEMCDTQHPPPALCGPEGLLKQVRSLCAARGVPLSGENALPIFLVDGVDSTALDRIVYNTRVWHGAAAMSAYWHARKDGGQCPSPELLMMPHGGVDSNSHGGAHGSGQHGYYVHHSDPHNPHNHHQPQPQYQHRKPVHSGSGSLVSGAQYGGGMYGGRMHQLPPVRSDPAITATGLRGDSYADISEPLPPMRSFTFLRLAPQILQPSYQAPWMKFMWKMREGGFC